MSLTRRSVTSSVYNVTANVISLAASLVGSITLARLLDPAVLGVFAFVTSIVQLTAALPNFGFQAAFLHRTGGPEGVTEQVLRVHFTLKLLFSTVWAVLMAAGVALLAPEDIRWVFWLSILAAFVAHQTTTINVLLTRRVQFRRLAAVQAVTAVATSAVAVLLAWRGWELWSLVSASLVAVVLEVVLLYVICPVWRPRLGWSQELVDYFIRFGSKVFAGAFLAQALDRVDDVWTGAVLGNSALGFYDKAYSFATYPRSLLSAPLAQVVAGTYAQLRDDRLRLSQVFSWTNFLMVRANFAVAAVLWLVAPEVIRFLLGDKWLPMLDAFRLMLVYTLFDPLKSMVALLLTIAGAPERVIRARAVQLGVLVVGLVTLGPRLGIAGVALAVDAMLVVGMAILYAEARRFVDFSLRRFFVVPTLALSLGLGAVYGLLTLSGLAGNDWLTGLLKGAGFSLTYAGVLFMVEREQLFEMSRILRQSLGSRVKRSSVRMVSQ